MTLTGNDGGDDNTESLEGGSGISKRVNYLGLIDRGPSCSRSRVNCDGTSMKWNTMCKYKSLSSLRVPSLYRPFFLCVTNEFMPIVFISTTFLPTARSCVANDDKCILKNTK